MDVQFANRMLLNEAFERVIKEEDMRWIKIILEKFHYNMSTLIENESYARDYILSNVRGFILIEESVMGQSTNVVLGSPYFSRVIPFLGISHYSKAEHNRLIASRMNPVMVKYIESKGFKVGLSDGNDDPALNGEIVIYVWIVFRKEGLKQYARPLYYF